MTVCKLQAVQLIDDDSSRTGLDFFSKIADRLKTHARLRQVLEMASCNADAAAPSSDVGNGVKELLGYIWVSMGI